MFRRGKGFALAWCMFKSLLVGTSLLALASLVGCAEPVAIEESGETTSRQVSYPKSSYDKVLDALEEKANNCGVFNESEIKTLESFQSRVDWTFEAYLTFTCSYEQGMLVVSGVSMEKRAGWSSADGVFTEQALDVSASIDVPLKAVELSAGVTDSVSVRQAKGTVTHDHSVSVSAGVSKDFGVVTGTASVSFDADSVSVSGGASVPFPIPTEECRGGEQKVGFTVSLTAEQVLDNHGLSDIAASALRERAVKIQTRGIANYHAMGSLPSDYVESSSQYAERLQACCDGWNTCD